MIGASTSKVLFACFNKVFESVAIFKGECYKKACKRRFPKICLGNGIVDEGDSFGFKRFSFLLSSKGISSEFSICVYYFITRENILFGILRKYASNSSWGGSKNGCKGCVG